ncbi:DNA-processing protein DprA [Kocuria marina]|uniref:DNA-processing protein DprA n=1 Tax=Kocuria TaxID=57493 RepID=UPI00187745EA|nr:hypothetical protein GCM10007061_10800 [Kocuria marina]
MATLAERMQGERMARVALSMVAEPNDSTTGRVLAQVGGVETLRLVESNDPVPGLARADTMIWRERLAARVTPDLPDRVAETQGGEFGTLLPADKEWPAGLDDLGERASYLLWTRGATSFLTAALSNRVTITGSRAATSYGEHVAGELVTSLADEERVVVSGDAYGIEGAAHKSVLAACGQTIAVSAGGAEPSLPCRAQRAAGSHRRCRAAGERAAAGRRADETQVFLARNRLLAALSGATVIPEAGPRSGSMTTVIAAHELGRGVGAVPGPVTSATSSGPNQLIRQGFAQLITEPSELLVLLDADEVPSRAATGPGVRQQFDRRPQLGRPGRSL